MAVLSLSNGLQRHHRWKIPSQMRYVLTECRTSLVDCYVIFPSTQQTHCHTFILPFHQIEYNSLMLPLVGDVRVYVQVLCEWDPCIQFTTWYVGKRTYCWCKGPRIKRTHDEGPVGNCQLFHLQANIHALFWWEVLVREGLEKHFRTGGK
jgi:hypothetical protein